MKTPQLARSGGGELNVTPLIDVVFLLIIFFLVSSHLARQETQIDLDLPTARSGLDDPQDQAAPRVTINILPDGRLLLGGVEADVAEIERRLTVERQRQSDPLEVRLRGDRRVPFGAVEPLLKACAAAQVWNVEFAVLEGPR